MSLLSRGSKREEVEQLWRITAAWSKEEVMGSSDEHRHGWVSTVVRGKGEDVGGQAAGRTGRRQTQNGCCSIAQLETHSTPLRAAVRALREPECGVDFSLVRAQLSPHLTQPLVPRGCQASDVMA